MAGTCLVPSQEYAAYVLAAPDGPHYLSAFGENAKLPIAGQHVPVEGRMPGERMVRLSEWPCWQTADVALSCDLHRQVSIASLN